MNEPVHILILEDVSTDADLAQREIGKSVKDCEFMQVQTRKDFLNALETFRPAVILSDYSIPRFNGMKALELTLEHAPLTPLIIWGGSLGEDVAVECMKAGANNYIVKDNIKRLGPAVLRALEERRLLFKRKQADEKVRSQDDRFRALIEHSMDSISLLAADGSLLWENPAVNRTLGYKQDQFIGHSIFELMHPDDLGWTSELFSKLLKNPGRTESGVFRFRHQDGTWRWIDAIVTNLLNEPSVGAIVVNYRDVTENREADERINESEERFSKAFNLGPAALSISHLDGGIFLAVNEAYLSLYGYEYTEVVGHTPFELNMYPDKKESALVMKLLHEQAGFQDQEFKTITKSGEVRTVVCSGEPIELGGEKYMLSFTTDITERTQAERDMRDSEERFRLLFDRMLDGVYRSTHNGNFVDVNPAMVNMFGYSSKEEMLEVDIKKELYFEPEERGSHLLDTGREEVDVYRMRRKDGSEIWVEDHGSYVHDEQGNIIYHEGILRDITERKKAEQELHNSDERFRQLAENIEEVFWISDPNSGKDIYISPACEKIWGLTVDEVLHSTDVFNEIILPEDRPKVLQGIEKQRGGKKTEIEYRITRPDGSVRWLWDRAFPILDDAGRVVRVLGIAADITERKRNETEATRHIAEMQAIYENGLAMGQLLEVREIGERIINTFTNYLSWHHVTIRLKKDEGEDLELVAFSQPYMEEHDRSNVEENFTSHINKVGQGLSGWVIQTGNPIRTGNVHQLPQYVDVHEGIQSGLYMPLMIGKFVIGVISVESEEPDAFGEEDERLLATLANQAAVAFENARLYQSVRQELNERKRVEDALRSSETYYRDLADSITDVFFELDHDLCFTHWNKASEALTGIPAADAIGKTMLEIFGESDEQLRIKKIYKSVFSSHQPRTFQTLFPWNNEVRSFEINAYPSTRGVSVMAKDVTESKRSEIILQKRFELMEYSSHHSLNELMQRTTDEVSRLTGSEIAFFHFVEQDGNSLGMQTWSTNTLKLFDVPVSLGTHLPLDQAGVWAEAARQRRSIIQNDYETISPRKELVDGHVKIVREMVIPIIRNERILAILGVANKAQEYTQQDLETAERLADYAWDITERKRMETALLEERTQLANRVEERTSELIKANSNLARAIRVKDEFLANMSHELRTPLNAILGLSESLAEQIAGSLNDKQLKYITTIGESGHHLLSLINDILDLAKIEAGQITLDINKVDVNSVCQASLRMIKQLAQKKEQEVIVTIDDNIGLIWADERRLKQMVVNLLSNAVKFTPENGTLGLEVHGYQEENRVEFSVWDNGIGVSMNDLPRLFQPFIQLDSGLARESTGTGLGLVLVSQMARLHGGSVKVDSEPGKGSRFTIMLPWNPAPARDTVEKLKNTGKLELLKPDPANQKNILLIEDTMEVIMMIKDYLESAGYKVTTAQDGIEGINQAMLTHPDLILMDVQMPRMDGIEATKKLRADPRFKHVPIIALTALAMPNDRELCIAAGMDEYMSKPANLKELIKIIQKYISASEEKTRPL